MTTTTRELRLTGACTIRAASASPGEAAGGKLATFSGLAYAGGPMKPEGWDHPVVVDLGGVKLRSPQPPALRQHDQKRVVGHMTLVRSDSAGIHVAGVFSGPQAEVDEVVGPAKKGFPWQMSIGADPKRTRWVPAGESVQVNGRTVDGPVTVSEETEIGEVSFVAVGADPHTSVQISAQKARQGKGVSSMWQLAIKAGLAALLSRKTPKIKAAVKQFMAEKGKDKSAPPGMGHYSDDEIDTMSHDHARAALKKCMKAAGEDVEEDEEGEGEGEGGEEKKADAAHLLRIQAGRKAEADELHRVDEIKARCKKHGVTACEVDGKQVPNLAAYAITAGWTADRAELVALRTSRPGAGVGLPGGLGYATSAPQLSEAVLEAAVLQAARHQYHLEHDDYWEERRPGESKPSTRPGLHHIRAQTGREIKARYTDQVQQHAHDLYRGRIGLHQLFHDAFRAKGHDGAFELKSQPGITAMLRAWDRYEGDERPAIRAEGASNLSVGNVLANVLNKFALQGYLYVEQAWREIAAVRAVSDFKPAKSINLLGDVMYRQIGPTGELQNASLGDQAFANQAQAYGRILTIPWQHIVNDDLGMLTGAPMKIGQGAGLALNDLFWSLWSALTSGSVASAGSAGNPNGALPSGYTITADDGAAFWRTTTGQNTKAKQLAGTAYLPNKATGAGTALSTTSLQTAKALFDNQVDPNGNPLGFDGATPVLLHGPTLWQTVQQLLYGSVLIATGLSSTSAAAVQPATNVWAGTMRPVMSKYVENVNYVNSTTAWWMLYNPTALPVVEVCFLNGVDTPAVLTAGPDYQFDRLGITIRGTMPFGCNQQQFRGGVFMAGA